MIREQELARTPLRLEHRAGPEALESIRAEWEALFAESEAPLFLAWAWCSAAQKHVHPGRSVRLLLARDPDGRLAGLLPLCEERRLGARVWRFLGDLTIGSDHLDALCRAGREDEVRAALFAELCAGAGRDWDALELLDLDDGGAPLDALRAQAARAGLPSEVALRDRCPRIEIQGDWESYLARVGRADNLKRRRKWLEKQPGYAVEVATAPAEVAQALEAFFGLHQRRWAAEGGSGGITGPQVQAFHREALAGLAAQGQVRLYTMRLQGQAVASVYVLVRGRDWAFYQSGYDPDWASKSPGLVLLARTMEDAFREGAQLYDLLRGEERYKFEWANAERRLVALRVDAPTHAARRLSALEGAADWAKGLARSVAPQGAWAKAQQWRRRLGI